MDANISLSDGTVSSIANLASAALKFFTPKETEVVSLDYENEAKALLSEQNDILLAPDSLARANQLGAFYLKLCLATGHPAGQLSGVVFPVPVEVLQSLGESAIDDIKAGKYLAGALRAANKA